MTGRDLISASLRLIGALAPGETLAASEATDGLSSLNRMIGSWSNEGLLIYARVREAFTLTPNDADYTIGTGANFNTSRPVTIEEALIRVETSSPALEYPMRILSLSEWVDISAKESTSTIPTDLYFDTAYPFGTINLFPMPSEAHKLVLYSWKPLAEIASLDTAISLPPGYERALVYNGAIELAPEYGRQVPAEVIKVADESMANIKRGNHKPAYLGCDAALLDRSAQFDIMRGDRR